MLPALIGDAERYLHADDALPPLVRVGLAHVQFETIHPYLDGNGRIGRLLIALLSSMGPLRSPLLYLSLFFKRHRDEYYRRLTAVRTDGDWEGWTDFFLDGVATIADEAVASARELFAGSPPTGTRVLATKHDVGLGRTAVRDCCPGHPIVTVASTMKLIDTSKPTATRAIDTLVAAGVLVETTGRKRDRSFAYQAYIDRLRTSTDLEQGSYAVGFR